MVVIQNFLLPPSPIFVLLLLITSLPLEGEPPGMFGNKLIPVKHSFIADKVLSIFPDLGGSPRQEKPAKSPRKGGSEMLAVLR